MEKYHHKVIWFVQAAQLLRIWGLMVTPTWRSQVRALGELKTKNPCCLLGSSLGTGAVPLGVGEQSLRFPGTQKERKVILFLSNQMSHIRVLIGTFQNVVVSLEKSQSKMVR